MGRKLRATVKAGARQNRVEEVGAGDFRISVTAPAHDGLANQAVIMALAQYFAIPKTAVAIVRGHSARIKFIEIDR